MGERLKAAEEEAGGELNEEEACGFAAAGADGMERSRRSLMPPMPPMLLLDAAGLEAAGELNEEKPASPLDCWGLVVRFCTGGDLGLESKKLPPPPNMLEEEEVVEGDFALEKASRPAKGEGLGAGAGAAPKDRLLKASFMPPKAEFVGDVCDCGDARPPNDSCRACCCCCCCWGCAAGLGDEAYSDRIDCLRSGREGAADALGPVLEGRAGGAELLLLPRKSKPSSESPAFVCFGGAGSAFGGGARAAAGGPVLDRGGAGVASPKRSMTGSGFACGGGGGREAAALPARRCEADRSTWIFSCTLESGCLGG